MIAAAGALVTACGDGGGDGGGADRSADITLSTESGTSSRDRGAGSTVETSGADLEGTWVGEAVFPENAAYFAGPHAYFVSLTCDDSACAVVGAVSVVDFFPPVAFDVEGTRDGDVVRFATTPEGCAFEDTHSLTITGDTVVGELAFTVHDEGCGAIQESTAPIAATASAMTLDEFVEANTEPTDS